MKWLRESSKRCLSSVLAQQEGCNKPINVRQYICDAQAGLQQKFPGWNRCRRRHSVHLSAILGLDGDVRNIGFSSS